MGKKRMYVDEVGNADLRASSLVNHRYLSITGVVFDLCYVQSTASPALEELKRRYFGSHPDEPVVLHRKELMAARHPFQELRDLQVREAFDVELLALIDGLDFTVVTVVRVPRWLRGPQAEALVRDGLGRGN